MENYSTLEIETDLKKLDKLQGTVAGLVAAGISGKDVIVIATNRNVMEAIKAIQFQTITLEVVECNACFEMRYTINKRPVSIVSRIAKLEAEVAELKKSLKN